MSTAAFHRGVERLSRSICRNVGEEVRRLREDGGISRAGLARAAGIDASYLTRIELGEATPSIETIARLSLALGTDLSVRLYPSAGAHIRDRHQAPIAEALLETLHPRWRPFPEVAVRHPARGWIDLGLHDPVGEVFTATEIESQVRRLEQLIRWSQAKADSVRSWDGWTHLVGDPSISRLLLIRETRINRSIADGAAGLLRSAYPANGHAALASLERGDPWPGPAVLWAVRDRSDAGRYRIAVRG